MKAPTFSKASFLERDGGLYRMVTCVIPRATDDAWLWALSQDRSKLMRIRLVCLLLAGVCLSVGLFTLSWAAFNTPAMLGGALVVILLQGASVWRRWCVSLAQFALATTALHFLEDMTCSFTDLVFIALLAIVLWGVVLHTRAKEAPSA